VHAGAGTDNDEAACGHAASGAGGNNDEAVGCAASGAGGSSDAAAGGCATSGADGSDDEMVGGCAALGVEGGGWDVASEGCSPSVQPFPCSACFACLYPLCLLFPREFSGGVEQTHCTWPYGTSDWGCNATADVYEDILPVGVLKLVQTVIKLYVQQCYALKISAKQWH